jgi:hypothetical protein
MLAVPRILQQIFNESVILIICFAVPRFDCMVLEVEARFFNDEIHGFVAWHFRSAPNCEISWKNLDLPLHFFQISIQQTSLVDK